MTDSLHPTAARLQERLHARGLAIDVVGLRRASADEVRQATGFAVGGVPPLGHDRPLRTIVDESLDRFDRLWCAAGTPHAVFEVSRADLVAAIAAAERDAPA